ncbi:hypothetical protein HUJ04_011325 [Dendroctonus ponderosae]|nr:hypothetical protein HUJ04_011325 [Dendroctonus ponderosae]
MYVMDAKQLKCSMCQYIHYSTKKLILHFKEIHYIQIESGNMKLALFDDFPQWKYQFEKETTASFVNMHGSFKTQFYTKIKYTCNRSGDVRRKGNTLRHLKCRGSRKINVFCPASISVIIKNGQCEVDFIKTHVGHKREIGGLFLTALERKELASKIASRVPFQTILDNVHLYNIEKAYNLNSESVRHANDAVSVDCWGPVEMLLNFEDDCICLDGTRNGTFAWTEDYGFQMNSLLVIVYLREGYPRAFLISSRSDKVIMSIFFSYIKNKIGKIIKPKIFMTDMAESFYNARIQVMDPPQFRLKYTKCFEY